MVTEHQMKRCLLCRAVDLRVLRVRQRLNKTIAVLLMPWYVVLEAGKDGLIDLLGLDVCLWMVRCGRYVLDFEQCAQC